MIYRVIVSVGYNKACYDFDTIEEAGDFARTILIHQTPNDDTIKKNSVRVEVIDASIIKEAEGEEDD